MSQAPEVEVIPDEEAPESWHINVRTNDEVAKAGLFLSVSVADGDRFRYIDIIVNEGRHVTVLSAWSE